MHHRNHALAAALGAAALCLPPQAHSQGSTARVDPADPKAAGPQLMYRSVFADYKPFQDIAPGEWRRLNDTVGNAALKPGAAPTSTGAVPASPPAASAPSQKAPMLHQPGHHQQMQGGRP